MSPSIGWGLLILSLVSCCVCQSNSNDTDSDNLQTRKRIFPPHFWFGVSTAAYPIEGAWKSGGKSQNIWDVYTHTAGNIRDNSTGDDACRSYDLYSKCDSKVLKYLNPTTYKFSISWSRILPDGFPNNVNQAGIDYYAKILDDLHDKLIHPIVTMYHWDLPVRLQALGGWANPLIAYWMEDYARVLFENFGNRVNTWITIDDPNQIVKGYTSDKLAPGLAEGHGTVDYIVAKNVIMAHARVFHLYDKVYRKKAKRGAVGIAITTDHHEPLTNSTEDIQAASDAFDFNVGMYTHPIFSPSGGFPPRVLELVAKKSEEQGFFRSRLFNFTSDEIAYCKEAADFYAMNYYTTYYWTRNNYKSDGIIPSKRDDLGAVYSFKNYPRTAIEDVAVIPHGIQESLKYIKANYANPLILITEIGIATNEGLEDRKRIEYLKQYLGSLLNAIYEDEVQVVGCGIWSLMDDFEWKDGYKVQYGLFHVDFEAANRKRQAKLSAIWYRDLIIAEALDPSYVPAFNKTEFCTN